MVHAADFAGKARSNDITRKRVEFHAQSRLLHDAFYVQPSLATGKCHVSQACALTHFV